jgi:outer membrane receptor protein involved in Fe transport
VFSFEKKNQKTFVLLGRFVPTARDSVQKFFASFFQKRSASFFLRLTLALTGVVPTIAYAAAPIETIVVTAQRRAARLDRTPVTVSVISGKTLAQRGVRELKQLKATVPGLTMSESPGGLPQVTVRGVGTSAANQLFEQSVGLFLDGIYQPRAREYRDTLFDLSQIEVIKGPQGVLYGKNTGAGAITVTSTNPGSAFGGYLASSYETSFGSYSEEGAVDVPVNDKLRFRMAALYEDDGGYVYNETMQREEGEDRRWIVRGTSVLDITDDITATLKMQASHLQTVGDLFQWVVSTDPKQLESYGIADGGGVPFIKYESSAPYGEAFDRQDSYAPSLRLNWQLPNGATLTSLTGYSAYRFADALDSDASPGPEPTVLSKFYEGFSQESEELHYTSAGDARLTYQGGLYAQHQHDQFDYENLLKDFYLIPAIKALNVSGIGTQDFTQPDTAFSAFAQVDYKFTDAIKLTLGGRLGQENKTGTYVKAIPSNLGVPGSAIGLVDPLPPGPIGGRLDDTSFDAAAVLSAQATATTLLYASAGRATKSGAFNNTAAFGVASPTPFTVRPEITTSFEAGIKQSGWNNRLFATVAVYHAHIDGYQDSYYSTSALGFLVRSVNANTTGIEAEARAKLNDHFSLFGNTAFEPQANITDGEHLQRAPRFTAAIGGAWQQALSDAWQLGADGQLQYSSSYLNQSAIAPGLNTSGDYALLDLRLALTDVPRGLEFSLRADNLLDRRYIVYSYGSLLSTAYLPGAGGTPLGSVGIINRPRTFTLGVRKAF